MSHYIDTSAIVAALVIEVHTPSIMTWLPGRAAGTVFISEWSLPEVASALSIKLRTGQITIEQRSGVLAAWSRMQATSAHTLAIEPAHYETTANFADQHQLGIRAGDALHLAVAKAAGFTLVTFDPTMAKAAPLLGVPVEPLG